MEKKEKLHPDYLLDMLKEIALNLEKTVNVVLIGGLAMVHHGIKETTKDIDIVFNDEKEITHFIRIIKSMGFHRRTEFTDEYLDLKAHAIYYSDNGHMLDLFLHRILDGFYLSENMIDRSEKVKMEGKLSISVLSPVDIFLFKSITMRDGDLVDMAYLAPLIKDWTPFEEELRFYKFDPFIVSRSYEKVKDLLNEHLVSVPLSGAIEDVGEMATAKTIVLGTIQFEPKKKTLLFEGLEPHEKYLIEEAIKELYFDGAIFDHGDTISLKSYPDESKEGKDR